MEDIGLAPDEAISHPEIKYKLNFMLMLRMGLRDSETKSMYHIRTFVSTGSGREGLERL